MKAIDLERKFFDIPKFHQDHHGDLLRIIALTQIEILGHLEGKNVAIFKERIRKDKEPK